MATGVSGGFERRKSNCNDETASVKVRGLRKSAAGTIMTTKISGSQSITGCAFMCYYE